VQLLAGAGVRGPGAGLGQQALARRQLRPRVELLRRRRLEAGARPADARAGEELHVRTMAGTSVDVHRVQAGEPRTIVPERAEASLSVRLAGGQRSEEIAPALERLLRDALPEGAELELRLHGAEPSRFDPAAPALQAARRALEAATGVAPVVVRSGGSIPILAAFAERGIPTIVGGFALPEDRIHAPDESYRIASLELGLKAARALYAELASLA